MAGEGISEDAITGGTVVEAIIMGGIAGITAVITNVQKGREAMKPIFLSFTGAIVLASTAAVAAPLNVGAGSLDLTNVEQVRLVCNEYGRCRHTRGPRYVVRGYDNYRVRRSYGYYGGGPRYYGRDDYYSSGPSIGFSFGSRGW